MFMRLPANDPAPTASPRVKTKLAAAVIALLLAFTMMACGSESSPPSETASPTAVSQAATQSSSGSADSSTNGNATTGAAERQQPDSAQSEATAEPASVSAGNTPTDEPEPTATMVPTPTLEPNENAFRWLLHEPDNPRCTFPQENREAIAREMTKPVLELSANAYHDARRAAIEEMGSYEALSEHFHAKFLAGLDLERLPDENGELRVSATYTGSLAPVTDDVYTVTFVPGIRTAPAVELAMPGACQAEDEEIVAIVAGGGKEATITDATGAAVNPRPEPEPFPLLAMVLGEYDAKDQFGNWRYIGYQHTKIFKYNLYEIEQAIRPSLNKHIQETYPTAQGADGSTDRRSIESTVYRSFRKSIDQTGIGFDVDWTLNEDNTVNVTVRPILRDLFLEGKQQDYILTIEAVMNLVPSEEIPRLLRRYRLGPGEPPGMVYPFFSHLVETPIKLEPCTTGPIPFGRMAGAEIYVCQTE